MLPIHRRLKAIERYLANRRKAPTVPERYSIDWLRGFVPEFFPLRSPQFHYEIAENLPKHEKLVITAPRGSAKSTVVTLGYPLYCALFRKDIRYILIVSDTFSQAAKLLASIQYGLERNKIEHTHSASRILLDGKLIEALGAGCRVRGRRWKQDRPNLIVLDDPQGHLDLISESAREARWDWFLRDLLPAGAQNCQYVVVGTTIHEGSIVHRLKHEWPSLSYAALTMPDNLELWKQWSALSQDRRDEFYRQHIEEMSKGVSLLWPERWDLPTLMGLYFSLGEDVFRSEYLQEPSLGTIHPLFAHFITDETLVDFVPQTIPCQLVSIDPAYSTKRSADWCAVTNFYPDWDSGTLFIASHCTRGDWVSFSTAQILENRPRDVVIEINASLGQAANILSQQLLQTWNDYYRFPTIQSHYWSRIDQKHKRIVSGIFRLFASSWKIRVTRTSTELVNEFRYYPNSRYDDALDSLVLGLRYLFPSEPFAQ